jgi:hypothetical protein
MTSRFGFLAIVVACGAALLSCASQPSPHSLVAARQGGPIPTPSQFPLGKQRIIAAQNARIEAARADPAPKVRIAVSAPPPAFHLALPASKYLHSSAHIKCGELPFPGVIYQQWHDVNCWYLFYVVHGRDDAYSLIAGQAPDRGRGELLYNRANGAIAVARMPAACAPRIANVRPPLVDISCGVDRPPAVFDLRSGSLRGH